MAAWFALSVADMWAVIIATYASTFLVMSLYDLIIEERKHHADNISKE